jgi:putative transposase
MTTSPGAHELRHAAQRRLHCSEQFVDFSPAAIVAALLDKGRYLCSERTIYRLLSEQRLVRERRAQLRHPKYEKPQLLATAPNQVWSWDITKLLGPTAWTFYYRRTPPSCSPISASSAR